MRENRETSGQMDLPCGGPTGSVKPGTKKYSIPGVLSCGIAASLLSLALVLASCDGGSTGSDPEIGDSSSSGLQTNSSSGGVTPGSSSGGTAIVSGSSAASSSSGTQTGSSSSSYTCDEGDMVYLTLSGVKVYYTCEGNTWVPVPVSSSSSSVVSSSSALSSSSYYDMDSLFNGGLSYGEFTDPRDGQTYKTIVVNPGSLFEYEIFAENLNYGKQVGLGEAQTDSTKYCYDDDAWYCGNHFGGLYRWSTAMGFPAACDSVEMGSSAACPDTITLPEGYAAPKSHVQYRGVCPEGWHVMNQSEWGNILGGGAWKIESAAGWNDNYNNTLGFSALPGGRFYSYGGAAYATYEYMGTMAYFWLPQEQEGHVLGARSVTLTSRDADNTSHSDFKTNGLSVRCVKDHEI